jgi:anti-anti-sigma factor
VPFVVDNENALLAHRDSILGLLPGTSLRAPQIFSPDSKAALSTELDTEHMPQVNRVAPFRPSRPAVVIDLVGDLDATLAAILAETLDRLEDPEVVISCKRLAFADETGLGAVTRALDAARRRGCNVVVSASARKLRVSFAAARIAFTASGDTQPPARRRSIIIAHNSSAASKTKLRRLPQIA